MCASATSRLCPHSQASRSCATTLAARARPRTPAAHPRQVRGERANDLEAGDEGLYCEALKRKKAEPAAGEKPGGKRKRKKAMVSWGEWEWDPKAEFVIERLIGRMVADGGDVPGRSNVPAGTVLYKVLWDGWPEEIATWEEEENIPCGEVDFVAQYDARMDGEGADGAAERDSDGDSSDDEAV